MAKKIYLSPSTQENNTGYGGYIEEIACNNLMDLIEKILKDYNVVIKRNKPSMSLSEVVADSNKFNPTFHFALHTNAYNRISRGCEVFSYDSESKGYELACALYKAIAALTPTLDRGVKFGKNFYGTGKHMYELAHTIAPAALAEIIFHDNKDDVVWFLAHQQELAEAIVKVIVSVMGLTKKRTESWKTILKKCSKWSDVYIKDVEIMHKKNHNWKGLIPKIWNTARKEN